GERSSVGAAELSISSSCYASANASARISRSASLNLSSPSLAGGSQMRYIVIGFMTHSTQLRGPNMSQGAWRSAAAIGVSLGAMLAATGVLFLLAALPFLVALDWETRQRRDFARRLHHET